jgi:hypothetical protein
MRVARLADHIGKGAQRSPVVDLRRGEADLEAVSEIDHGIIACRAGGDAHGVEDATAHPRLVGLVIVEQVLHHNAALALHVLAVEPHTDMEATGRVVSARVGAVGRGVVARRENEAAGRQAHGVLLYGRRRRWR